MTKRAKQLVTSLLILLLLVGAFFLYQIKMARTAFYDTTYVMSTIVLQTAYGGKAQAAMNEVDSAFRAFEDRLSLFQDGSEVAAINAGAGSPVAVSADTFDLVQRSLALSATSDGAFDVTIAPLTLLWGVTTDHPQVPQQSEIDAILPLIDDSAVVLDASALTVQLAAGQAIDLGGIAKGNACGLAQQIYETYDVNSAVLNIGGNVYVRGTKPDGTRFRVGFRDPAGDENSYIASVALQDQVMAVSGGYERYFEQDGVRYCHIMNGRTGWPIESDIVSVGVITADGTLSDFMSTTLFVWGGDKTRAYMERHPEMGIILLDGNNHLYVSAALDGNFALTEAAKNLYTVEYI